ncbi:DUF1990 family protein [Nocardia concava]|uniref:DUF1990 family protein n=1 Tax=Nocardia concava TaxID=257281 RepID=UPI000318538F|nr:DUF1990 domain-containing protein [Nocardia concava]
MESDRDFTYGPVGATNPADPNWAARVPGFRRFETTTILSDGRPTNGDRTTSGDRMTSSIWNRATEELLTWGIKRRSGFRVAPLDTPDLRVSPGANFRITAAMGPIAIHEPIRIVAVVDTPDRAAFSYGTLPGHPVSGEEAFILHRADDNSILLTLRSLTSPAPNGVWRTAFPLLLVAQRHYRRRYLRALTP